MADFIIAYNHTNKNEGLWNHVPGDSGGQTWKGIAQLKHPKWDGWPIVEFTKSGIQFPVSPTKVDIDKLDTLLLANEKLELLVKKFYKLKFWDIVRGDEIIAQILANKLYDNSVNFGTSGAIKSWQNDVLKVAVTGIMDDISLKTLNQTS